MWIRRKIMPCNDVCLDPPAYPSDSQRVTFARQDGLWQPGSGSLRLGSGMRFKCGVLANGLLVRNFTAKCRKSTIIVMELKGRWTTFTQWEKYDPMTAYTGTIYIYSLCHYHGRAPLRTVHKVVGTSQRVPRQPHSRWFARWSCHQLNIIIFIYSSTCVLGHPPFGCRHSGT